MNSAKAALSHKTTTVLARTGRSVRGPIGVDIGARSIKIAQLRCTPSGQELERALILNRVVLDDTAAGTHTRGTISIQALAGILERQGFQGTRLVISAPQSAISGVVSVPPAAHEARLEVARHEAARSFGFEADSVEIAGWDTQPADAPLARRSGRDGVEMMIVGVDRAWGYERAARYRAAGLDLCVVDAPCIAKARGAAPDGEHSDGIALLDLGWTGMSIIVCVRGCVVYERRVETHGWGQFVTRLASELGMPARVAELMMSSIGLDDEGAMAFGGVEPPPESNGGGPEHADTDTDAADECYAAGGLRMSTADSERRIPGSVLEGGRPVRRMVHEYAEQMAQEFSAAMRYAGRRHASVEAWRFRAIGGPAGCPGISQFVRDQLGIAGQVVRASDVVRVTARTARHAESTELITAIGLARRLDA